MKVASSAWPSSAIIIFFNIVADFRGIFTNKCMMYIKYCPSCLWLPVSFGGQWGWGASIWKWVGKIVLGCGTLRVRPGRSLPSRFSENFLCFTSKWDRIPLTSDVIVSNLFEKIVPGLAFIFWRQVLLRASLGWAHTSQAPFLLQLGFKGALCGGSW